MSNSSNLLKELKRVSRVSDQMVSAHSAMRDKYSLLATIVDASIILISTVLVALAFADTSIITWLPTKFEDVRLPIGFLAVATFVLTIVSSKIDWKRKSESHGRAAKALAQVKLEVNCQIRNFDNALESDTLRILARYGEVSSAQIPIHERDFLRLKGRHLTKIRLSETLDTYPTASIRILRLRLWMRDTIRSIRHSDE